MSYNIQIRRGFVCIAALLLLACSAPEKDKNTEDCRSDADCPNAESVCEDKACLPGCSIDTDCEQNRICEARFSGPDGVCVVTAGGCSEDVECGSDEVCEWSCVKSCGIGAGCEAGSICTARPSREGGYCEREPAPNPNNGEPPVKQISGYIVQILDTTIDDCGPDVPDPGSDIIYIHLATDMGVMLGYGNLVSEGILGENNAFNQGLNLDGRSQSFEGICPEFNEDSVTSLGCGGYVAIEFHDLNGTPVAYESGMQIRVFEHGLQCDSGTNNDEYDIRLCSDTNAVKNDDDMTSCTLSLGGGSGEVNAIVFSPP